jgi:hypothetical protein
MAEQEKIDWSPCALVAVEPRVPSCAPAAVWRAPGRRTRLQTTADCGMSVTEISQQFEVSEDTIRAF